VASFPAGDEGGVNVAELLARCVVAVNDDCTECCRDGVPLADTLPLYSRARVCSYVPAAAGPGGRQLARLAHCSRGGAGGQAAAG
jgi:hypothetical protein